MTAPETVTETVTVTLLHGLSATYVLRPKPVDFLAIGDKVARGEDLTEQELAALGLDERPVPSPDPDCPF